MLRLLHRRACRDRGLNLVLGDGRRIVLAGVIGRIVRAVIVIVVMVRLVIRVVSRVFALERAAEVRPGAAHLTDGPAKLLADILHLVRPEHEQDDDHHDRDLYGTIYKCEHSQFIQSWYYTFYKL